MRVCVCVSERKARECVCVCASKCVCVLMSEKINVSKYQREGERKGFSLVKALFRKSDKSNHS